MSGKLAMSQTAGIGLLRLVLCAILFTHGAYRFFDGTTAVLGEILTQRGFPQGVLLASLVNLAETGGAILILLRRFAAPATLVLVLIYVTGIFLFHGKEGFFVIQPGNGGWEYSALLIVCLLVTLWGLRQPGFAPEPVSSHRAGPVAAMVRRVFDPARAGPDILRIVTCIIIFVHGTWGLTAAATPELGSLPGRLGPAPGALLVLAFNLACVVAPVLIVLRIGVVELSMLLIALLGLGIALWHAANGFFVVGPGDDGWEFSALLITCLVTTILANRQGRIAVTASPG